MVRVRVRARDNYGEYNSNGTTDLEDPDNNISMDAEGEAREGNIPGYMPTPQDFCLRYVYRDWVHTNDGEHLSGGIIDDAICQAQWRDIAVILALFYDAPGVKVGSWFVQALATELRVFHGHKWNSDNFIIFHTVILQWERHVTGEQVIQWRITKRTDAWDLDHH